MIENENCRPLPKTPKFTFHASEFQENLVISFPLNSTPGNPTKVTRFPLLRFHISPYPISLNQNNNAEKLTGLNSPEKEQASSLNA